MTNTRITDPEVLEHRFPVRLERFRRAARLGWCRRPTRRRRRRARARLPGADGAVGGDAAPRRAALWLAAANRGYRAGSASSAPTAASRSWRASTVARWGRAIACCSRPPAVAAGAAQTANVERRRKGPRRGDGHRRRVNAQPGVQPAGDYCRIACQVPGCFAIDDLNAPPSAPPRVAVEVELAHWATEREMQVHGRRRARLERAAAGGGVTLKVSALPWMRICPCATASGCSGAGRSRAARRSRPRGRRHSASAPTMCR